ncbi:MAG: hypothetical protein WCL50_10370, partial [Spirochaetota bacterium]
MRKHPLPAFTFAAGTLSHGLVLAGLASSRMEGVDRAEVASLLELAWLCSIATLATGSTLRFAAAHALRAIFIAMTLLSFARGDAVLGLLLVAPFIQESTLYLGTRGALAASAGTIAFVCAANLA